MLTSDDRPVWTGALPVTIARWLVRPPSGSHEQEGGPWSDQADAGRALGQRLSRRLAVRRARTPTLVLGLSGAGVRVAAEVAELLGAPLDALATPVGAEDAGPATVLAGAAPVAATTVVVVVDALVEADVALITAALAAVRSGRPAHLVLAAPAGTPSACAALWPVTDELLCAWTSPVFRTREQAYRHPAPLTAGQERDLIAAAVTARAVA